MTESSLRGHVIERLDGVWVFADTKEPTASSWESRSCGHCGLMNTDEGHDGCLGTLPGLMNACCGHGETGEAYIQLMDGTSIHGEDAEVCISVLKRNKKEDE